MMWSLAPLSHCWLWWMLSSSRPLNCSLNGSTAPVVAPNRVVHPRHGSPWSPERWLPLHVLVYTVMKSVLLAMPKITPAEFTNSSDGVCVYIYYKCNDLFCCCHCNWHESSLFLLPSLLPPFLSILPSFLSILPSLPPPSFSPALPPSLPPSQNERICGHNTSTLVVTKLRQADAGSYRCLVTNSSGVTQSRPATLTVGEAHSRTTIELSRRVTRAFRPSRANGRSTSSRMCSLGKTSLGTSLLLPLCTLAGK